MTARESGHRGRLRQRFLNGDAATYTDAALLELLLTYAIPRQDVRPLAERLLARFGDLQGVLSADVAALRAVDGIGESAAVLLRLTAYIGQPCVTAPSAPAAGVERGPQSTVTTEPARAPDALAGERRLHRQ